MDFNFTKPLPPKNSTPKPLTDIVAEYKASMDAYVENAKPKKLKDVLEDHKTTSHVYFFQIYHRDFLQASGERKKEIIDCLFNTTVIPNRKFAPNTVEVTAANPLIGRLSPIIEVSYDIWDNKTDHDLYYTFFGGVAQAIQSIMYDTINKKFHWQCIFYNMGFDPRKHIVERAEAEQTAAEILTTKV